VRVVNQNQPAPSDGDDKKIPWRRPPTWFFAKLFAAIAYVPGVCLLFYLGLHGFGSPPFPPDQPACGNAVFGDYVLSGRWLLMLFAPFAGIIVSIAAAVVGGVVDYILHFRN
jgi:hypothetical protein